MPKTNKLSKDVIAKMKQSYLEGASINKVARKFNVARSTVQRHLSDIRRPYEPRNAFELIPNDMTEEIAECAGIIAGDGTIWKEKNRGLRIRIRGNPKDEQEYYNNWVKPLFERTFNIKVLSKHFSGGSYGIEINSSKIARFFSEVFELPIGKKATTIKFPKCLLEARKEVKLAFLRGLIDTDGYIYFNTMPAKSWGGTRFKTLYVGLGLSSEAIIGQIKEILTEYSFKVSKITVSKGSPWTNNPEFNLRVCGIKSFYRYLSEIKSNNPRFKQKIDIITEVMRNG